MLSTDSDLLTKSQIRQMTRDELVVLVLDWLNRFRERAGTLIKESTRQQDLENAHKQIGLLQEKIDSITKDLNWSLKQNKYLETEQIPKLKQEIEQRGSQRNQLLSDIKQYKNKVKELQTTFKKVIRDSKQQIDKLLAEKKHVMSLIPACKMKIEKYQNEVKKLEIEVSRKNNKIGMKNTDIFNEKEKSRLLESKIRTLEMQLKDGEKERKAIEKKLKKTPMEEAIDRTKLEFKARIDLTSGVLAEEKERNKELVNRLLKKDRQVSKLLEIQAKQEREAVVVKKGFDHAVSDFIIRDLRKENRSLNGQIKVLTKSREKDQQHIKEVTRQGSKLRELYLSERMKHENFKESMKNKVAKVGDDIVLEGPKVQSKFETQTTNKTLELLPSTTDKITLQTPKTQSISNQRILILGEGKIQPDFKDDFTTPGQLEHKPEPKTKPKMPPFKPAGRQYFSQKPSGKTGNGQPGRKATTDGNSNVPQLSIKGNRIL